MKIISLTQVSHCTGGAGLSEERIRWASKKYYLDDAKRYFLITLTEPGDSYDFTYNNKKCTFTYNPAEINHSHLDNIRFSIILVGYSLQTGSKTSSKDVCGTTTYKIFL